MNKWIKSGGLVVSCQALPGEPLHGSEYMAVMAKSAELGGASGIRANGFEDIAAIKRSVNLPIIGLYKRDYSNSDIYITPTLEDALNVSESGADIVAIDGTSRKRPDGKTLEETIQKLKAQGIVVMAEVSTLEEGIQAEKFGADLISTTLSGYTPYSPKNEGADLDLIKNLVSNISTPVVAEGRIRNPEEALEALRMGAEFVVVGGAITRPHVITQLFVEELERI